MEQVEPNDYIQDLTDHLEEREWSNVQIVNLLQKIGRNALLSCEGVLDVYEYQQEIDEQIEAEKEFDRWAIARTFNKTYQPVDFDRQSGSMIPQSFYEDAEQYRKDAGWDYPEDKDKQ